MFSFAFFARRAARAPFGIALAAALLPASAANVTPGNLAATFCDDVIAGDLVVNSSMQINTDTAACAAGIGTSCVLRYNNVTVTSLGSINFTGSRPAVLTAQGDLTVQGGIVAGAGSDPSPSGASGFPKAGGGGAGGGTNGGNGGASDAGASGGNGGTARGNKTLRPLTGGARGGMGNGNQTTGGGSGGGALQLVACHTLTVSANVQAGGFGGSGGAAESSLNPANGGGGGGSGGGLLLEGDAVTITADLIANGGGGGGGGTSSFSTGNSGQTGNAGFGLSPATGGQPGSSSAGVGGSGGASGFPTGGSPASTQFGAGGGGGGAAGRIRIDFCTSASTNPALISPAATFGVSCSDVIFRDDFEAAT